MGLRSRFGQAMGQLVLTRREGQTIVIGPPHAPMAFVTVTRIKGDRASLAVQAPRDVEIHRAEIAEQIEEAAR